MCLRFGPEWVSRTMTMQGHDDGDHVHDKDLLMTITTCNAKLAALELTPLGFADPRPPSPMLGGSRTTDPPDPSHAGGLALHRLALRLAACRAVQRVDRSNV